MNFATHCNLPFQTGARCSQIIVKKKKKHFRKKKIQIKLWIVIFLYFELKHVCGCVFIFLTVTIFVLNSVYENKFFFFFYECSIGDVLYIHKYCIYFIKVFCCFYILYYVMRNVHKVLRCLLFSLIFVSPFYKVISMFFVVYQINIWLSIFENSHFCTLRL